MHQTAFEPSYTAFTADGARWLAAHAPWVRTVAIDYLSIARLDDIVDAHVALFSAVSWAGEGRMGGVEGTDVVRSTD